MKKLCIIVCGIVLMLPSWAQLPMEGWKLHTAYNNVTRVENGSDRAFAVSEGALFSVDKKEGSIEYYNKLTGLSSTGICEIKYDHDGDALIIAYQNGYIDIVSSTEIQSIPDLYNKQLSASKIVNDICIHERKAYLAMDFGVMVLNLSRGEIADTYYIGVDASEVKINSITVYNDSIFAAAEQEIYVASLKANLVDYSQWTRRQVPGKGVIAQILANNESLCVLQGDVLYQWNDSAWVTPLGSEKVTRVVVADDRFMAISAQGTHILQTDKEPVLMTVFVGAPDVTYDKKADTYWYAYYADGLGFWKPADEYFTHYVPVGPLSNTAYRMRFSGDRLYIVPGGYLGVFYSRPGEAMVYEKGNWLNYTANYMVSHITNFGNPSKKVTEDYSDIIADPNDPTHFYIASFGYGLMEFRNDEFYMRHMPDNSGIEAMLDSPWEKYTWVDAFAYDPSGNLWMANVSKQNHNLKVLTAEGNWVSYTHSVLASSERIKNVLVDRNNQNIKYVVGTYLTACIAVIDDNGTIDNLSDDRTIVWKEFIDGDGNTLTPNYIHSITQDLNGALWVGTETGIMKFDNPEQLLTSNACTRIKIARTDGSGLADYMLGEEQINAIAVDGVNRMWFGSQTTGAYLMDLSDPQNVVTVQYFTVDNSPLPSNTILSIAINPNTGEVFFGTGGGIVSYQSDAAEGKEDFSSAYAYPNPVRENFDGMVTIAGLMKDTQVRITDNGGNLVYETKSNGGIAVWDGRNGRGERVSSGVYFAMCVTPDGANKTLVKILIMN